MEAQAQTRAVDPPAVEPPVLVRDLLRKRGLMDDAAITAFLRPSYEATLGDPFLMTDMDKAVAFYRDTMGLTLRFQSPGWSEFATGETCNLLVIGELAVLRRHLR